MVIAQFSDRTENRPRGLLAVVDIFITAPASQTSFDLITYLDKPFFVQICIAVLKSVEPGQFAFRTVDS